MFSLNEITMKVIDIKTKEDITPVPPTTEQEFMMDLIYWLQIMSADQLEAAILDKYKIEKK